MGNVDQSKHFANAGVNSLVYSVFEFLFFLSLSRLIDLIPYHRSKVLTGDGIIAAISSSLICAASILTSVSRCCHWTSSLVSMPVGPWTMPTENRVYTMSVLKSEDLGTEGEVDQQDSVSLATVSPVSLISLNTQGLFAKSSMAKH